MLRRSQLLEVETPHWEITKYRHPEILDLYTVLDLQGLFRRGDNKVGARRLSFYLKRFGLPCHTDVSGADMAQAAAEGDWELIERHCREHVEETRALAKRLGVWRGGRSVDEILASAYVTDRAVGVENPF